MSTFYFYSSSPWLPPPRRQATEVRRRHPPDDDMKRFTHPSFATPSVAVGVRKSKFTARGGKEVSLLGPHERWKTDRSGIKYDKPMINHDKLETKTCKRLLSWTGGGIISRQTAMTRSYHMNAAGRVQKSATEVWPALGSASHCNVGFSLISFCRKKSFLLKGSHQSSRWYWEFTQLR